MQAVKAMLDLSERRSIHYKAVKAMLDLSGRRSIHFKDNMPGKSWWYCFMSRHPNMKLKQTEKLEMARAIACSESKVRNWF